MTAEEAKKICDNAHKKEQRADLRDANLSGADLRGANLIGADLRNANLIGANMRNADLICANMRDANLRNANLRGADLRDANLRGANLIGANLICANMRNADLRDADLRNADLIGANLIGANMRGANLPKRYIKIGPIGSRNDEIVYNVTDDILQCGCFTGTLEVFDDKVKSTHGNSIYGREYSAMIVFLKSMHEIEKEDKV